MAIAPSSPYFGKTKPVSAGATSAKIAVPTVANAPIHTWGQNSGTTLLVLDARTARLHRLPFRQRVVLVGVHRYTLSWRVSFPWLQATCAVINTLDSAQRDALS